MKKHFKEQYQLSQEEIDAIWSDCYIVLDANILLNFYRCSKDTSDDMFKILHAVEDKLWLPYQSVWEYHNNRRDVYFSNWNAAKTLMQKVKSLIDSFYKDEKIYGLLSRNPFVVKKEVEDAFSAAQEILNKVFEKYDQNIEDYTFNDHILDELTNLLEDRVGDDFSEDELKNCFKRGEARYKDSVPPGYKDDTKEKRAKGLRHVFGDFINWIQVMDKAKNDNKNIIFVSGDQKEDWWEEWHGKKVRPRTELIKEFRTETGMDILFYNQPSFMKYAKDNIVHDTKDASINEVQEVEDVLKEQEYEERLKETEEILRKYGYMGDGAPQSGLYIDTSANVPLSGFSSIHDYLTSKPFPKIDFVDMSKLYPSTAQIIPDSVTSTIESMRKISELASSANTQSALSTLAGIDNPAADQIKKLTDLINPQAISKAQSWIDNLPHYPKIKK